MTNTTSENNTDNLEIISNLAECADSIQADISTINESIDEMQASLGSIDDSLRKDTWQILVNYSEPNLDRSTYKIIVAIDTIPSRLQILPTTILIADIYSPSGSTNISEVYVNPTHATLKAADLYRVWDAEIKAHRLSRTIGLPSNTL